jgi:hypothetical protein
MGFADRFVVDRRHVHPREIAGAEQAREGDGVATIGLHLVARFLRNERRRDDLTREPLAGQISVQPVSARAGFVREHEVGRFPLQALRMGDGDRILVDVETNKKRSRLCHG